MSDTAFSVRGVGASPGSVVGPLALDLAQLSALAAGGEAPVLVVRRLGSDSAPSLSACAGLVVTDAGLTDDIAIIARSLGKPCVVGLSSLRIDFEGQKLVARDGGVERTFEAPGRLRIDGARGLVESA